MSISYQEHPPLDRVRIVSGLGGGGRQTTSQRPAYVPPQIVDLTLAQRAAICRSHECAIPSQVTTGSV